MEAQILFTLEIEGKTGSLPHLTGNGYFTYESTPSYNDIMRRIHYHHKIKGRQVRLISSTSLEVIFDTRCPEKFEHVCNEDCTHD